jgi:hypothetical protein
MHGAEGRVMNPSPSVQEANVRLRSVRPPISWRIGRRHEGEEWLAVLPASGDFLGILTVHDGHLGGHVGHLGLIGLAIPSADQIARDAAYKSPDEVARQGREAIRDKGTGLLAFAWF